MGRIKINKPRTIEVSEERWEEVCDDNAALREYRSELRIKSEWLVKSRDCYRNKYYLVSGAFTCLFGLYIVALIKLL